MAGNEISRDSEPRANQKVDPRFGLVNVVRIAQLNITMPAKSSALSEAPPTRQPSTSG